MRRQNILILALLALTLTVNTGLAFDGKQGGTTKKSGTLHKSGDSIRFAVETALDKTGKAFEKAGKKTGQALGIAADRTSQALERAEKKIQGWFDDRLNLRK